MMSLDTEGTNKKAVIFKTSVGITPKLYWGIFSAIIFILVINIELNVFGFSILIIFTLILLLATPSFQIVVRSSGCEVQKNRIFNLLKSKTIISLNDLRKVLWTESKWRMGLSYIPIIPHRTGKTIEFHLMDGIVLRFENVNIRSHELERVIDLLHDKMSE